MWNWIANIFRVLVAHLFVTPEPIRNASIPEDTHETSLPIEPSVPENLTASKSLSAVLAAIRAKEAGSGGYNADYQNDDRWNLSNYDFNQVVALGRSQVTTGGRVGRKEASSAIGAYQFLTKTLESLRPSLHLTGKEKFTPPFQDFLAYSLMVRRGFYDWVKGKISTTQFGDQLAMEWASLPVLSALRQGAHRKVRRGQSYYAGDGLNASLHSADEFEALLEEAKRKWRER